MEHITKTATVVDRRPVSRFQTARQLSQPPIATVRTTTNQKQIQEAHVRFTPRQSFGKLARTSSNMGLPALLPLFPLEWHDEAPTSNHDTSTIILGNWRATTPTTVTK